ncbi:hypothetical protein FRB96_000688 [Tulasnella sp. 330]|nr:hypothetical protein FRB96_000688 [Tulasnella sp. 330]
MSNQLDDKFDFPHPFEELDEDGGLRPLTLAELRMTELSYALRSKPLWWIKYKDPDIKKKWKAEALVQDIHSGRITEAEADFVLAELAGYDKMRDIETGIQQSCYSHVYESDTLIPSELHSKLVKEITKLEDVPDDEKDWHPRSDNFVLDLVHPSLYCAVYGRTLSYPLGKDKSVRKERDLRPLRRPKVVGTTCISEHFAWIPTDFHIASRTSAKALSYINNLHPSHVELYEGISELVARCSGLFDRVLTDLHPVHETLLRIDPKKTPYKWISAEDDPSPRDYDADDFEERYQEWEQRRTLSIPTVPKEGYNERYDPSKRAAKCSIVGRTVQVIVKLANIHLTPEKPEYGGGSWHVEGMANEHIVASGIYYYDSENITDSTLAFRTAINFIMEPYEQNDVEGARRVWGLDFSNQIIGNVKTLQDRCIAFPNIYQHRVSPFRLLDPGKPGHRKIIALFLVDPKQRIPSTSEIPPQQEYLAREAMNSAVASSLFHKMPSEMLDMVAGKVESVMTREEAKKYREKLMDERTAGVDEQNNSYFATEFNMSVYVTKKKCAEGNEPSAWYIRDNFRLLYAFIDNLEIKTAPSEIWLRYRSGRLYHVEIPAVLETAQSSAVSVATDRPGHGTSRNSSIDFIQRALSPETVLPDVWVEVSSAPALGSANVARRFRYKENGRQPGRGGFSYVREGILELKDGTKKDVAVKSLNPRNIMGREPALDVFFKLQDYLYREIIAWQGLVHDNVAPLLAYNSKGPFYLLTYWYPHGDIAQYVIDTSASYAHRLQLLRETAKGLQYLHKVDVVHGDMKSDNVVVTGDGHAIIIDFGLSVAFASETSDAELHDDRSLSLTCHRWMAPELFPKNVGGRLTAGRATPESDVFSFACVALEIASDSPPYVGIQSHLMVPYVEKGETSKADDYPTLAGSSSVFWQLLLDCWRMDPKKRPGMDEVLERIEALTETDVWKK